MKDLQVINLHGQRRNTTENSWILHEDFSARILKKMEEEEQQSKEKRDS